MGIGAATSQYWNVTPSDSPQTNGPIEQLWVGTGGALALVSGDGSTFTMSNPPVQQWINFPYPVKTVKATGTTATNIIAAGWGSPTQSS